MKRFTIASLMLVISAAVAIAGGGRETIEIPGLDGYTRIADKKLSYDFQWQIDGSNLNVQIAAPTTGWLAVGFDPSDKMRDANILIGYVADGRAFLRDDFGVGPVKHGPDTGQGGTEDFSNLEGEETGGVTVLRFTIPLDSGDANDKKLEEGRTYKVIYSYGANGKDDFGTYHTKSRGSFELTL